MNLKPKHTMPPHSRSWQYVPILIVALCLALLAACGAERSAQLPYLSPNSTILAFGDSLTYGTGAKREQSYPAVLSELIDRRVINAGVPGETTAEGLERLPKALDEHRPDLVLLCLGGNDFLRRKQDDQVRTNLARMIEIIQGRGIPLVLIGVPKPKLLLSTEALYEDLADEYGLAAETDIFADVLGDKSLKSDTIHPNAEGYRKVALALAALLDRAGAL